MLKARDSDLYLDQFVRHPLDAHFQRMLSRVGVHITLAVSASQRRAAHMQRTTLARDSRGAPHCLPSSDEPRSCEDVDARGPPTITIDGLSEELIELGRSSGAR